MIALARLATPFRKEGLTSAWVYVEGADPIYKTCRFSDLSLLAEWYRCHLAS